MSGGQIRRSPADGGGGGAHSVWQESAASVPFCRLARRALTSGGPADRRSRGRQSGLADEGRRRDAGAGKRRRDSRASRPGRAVRTTSLFLRLSRRKRCRRTRRACPGGLTRQNAQDHERGVHTSGSTFGATLGPPVQTTVQTTVGATLFEDAAGRLAQTSRTARAVELAQEVGQLPALALLFGELPGELGAVDVGLHRFEDQALELGRFEGFDLPLDGLVDVEAVPSREGRPTGVVPFARGRGKFVGLSLFMREDDALDLRPAVGAGDSVASQCRRRSSRSRAESGTRSAPSPHSTRSVTPSTRSAPGRSCAT